MSDGATELRSDSKLSGSAATDIELLEIKLALLSKSI